jgi:hypothetical protein
MCIISTLIQPSLHAFSPLSLTHTQYHLHTTHYPLPTTEHDARNAALESQISKYRDEMGSVRKKNRNLQDLLDQLKDGTRVDGACVCVCVCVCMNKYVCA